MTKKQMFPTGIFVGAHCGAPCMWKFELGICFGFGYSNLELYQLNSVFSACSAVKK